MIGPICDKCGEELKDFGGLIFSPPSPYTPSQVCKLHICVRCWPLLLDWIIKEGPLIMIEKEKVQQDSLQTREDYQKVFEAGRYLDMAVSYCHEGWTFGWSRDKDKWDGVSEYPPFKDFSIGICSYNVTIKNFQKLQPEYGEYLEKLYMIPLAGWPPEAKEAARELGEWILANSPGGC